LSPTSFSGTRGGGSRQNCCASHAPDENVGLLTRRLQLLLGLQSRDGLVEQNVVQNTPQGVLGIVVSQGVLDGFGNGRSQAAAGIGIGLQQSAAELGSLRGGWVHLGSVGTNENPSVGFLIVAAADHIHGALNPEHPAGKREGRSPLAGTGLGRDAPDPLLLVEIGLGNGGVGFMGSGRRDGFILKIDPRLRSDGRLEAGCPHQRGGSDKDGICPTPVLEFESSVPGRLPAR